MTSPCLTHGAMASPDAGRLSPPNRFNRLNLSTNRIPQLRCLFVSLFVFSLHLVHGGYFFRSPPPKQRVLSRSRQDLGFLLPNNPPRSRKDPSVLRFFRDPARPGRPFVFSEASPSEASQEALYRNSSGTWSWEFRRQAVKESQRVMFDEVQSPGGWGV